MKKLVSLVLVVLMLFSLTACESAVSESGDADYVKDRLLVLLDGYPKEIFEEMLNDPMPIDGSDQKSQEEKSLAWQAQLDEIYKDVAEPGTVVDVYMGTDLMTLWMYMITNEADFKLESLDSVEMTSDTNASYTAVITVIPGEGAETEATISGSVQLSENGLISFLQIHSFDEVRTALGVELP